jgi:hypothetical protein
MGSCRHRKSGFVFSVCGSSSKVNIGGRYQVVYARKDWDLNFKD